MSKTSRVAAVAAVVFAGFVVWIVGGFSQGWVRKAIDDIVLFAVAFVAASFSVQAARAARGRVRLAWVSLSVGLAGWALGAAIWAFYELKLHELPFPTIADAGYLLLPVGACLAMLLLPSDYSGQARVRMLLDGVIVAGSLFVISWIIVLSPIYAAGADSQLAFFVSVAYPASDVVVLTVAAVVLVRAASDQRLVLTLLTVGMACIALSDSYFVYLANKDQYSSGSVIDIGWVAGLLLITVAAAAASESAQAGNELLRLPSWASIWLPYAPLLLAAIVTAAEPARALQSGPVEVIAGLLVVAVLIRQFLTVTENRRLLSVVAEQALRDPLTGLGNRTLFDERLDHAMALRERGDLSVGLIVLDLNDFKLVNDALGHPAGDCLLRLTAERILRSVRSGDTVARLGGDEFAVLVEDHLDQSHVVAHRIIQSFERPFTIEGQEVMVNPSVGLAVAAIDEPAVSAEELLKRADVAMYSAKKSRVGGVHTFNAEMRLSDPTGRDAWARRGTPSVEGGTSIVQLLAELRRAIDQFELVLHYQPKYDLRTSAIAGVEALVRWPHPERGLLGPNEFLHLVRRHGMMWPMTELVVNKALDDAAQWHSESIDVPVAVNLFAPLLADLSLPARIAKGLADRGLSAKALTVELTEDLLLGNIERTRQVMTTLRQNGIRIAIDDFGQAYSTFSYLRDLPVDEVKLDYNFVASIAHDRRAAVVAQAVLEMSHKLGMATVAEGVENAETVEMLREFGCDMVQGFYFCPPLTGEEMAALLKSSASGVGANHT